MKLEHFAVLLIAVVIICVGVVYWAHSSFYTFETKTVAMDIEVGKTVGITLDTDALHFGRALPGGSSTRKSLFTNTHNTRMKVIIEGKGQLGDWLTVSENGFILYPGEAKEVSFTISVPLGTEHGNYTGYVEMIYQKALLF